MFVILGALAIAAAIYVLSHERLTLPNQNIYTLRAKFSAADGVVGGVGQPVDVVGVNVGQVTSVQSLDGAALVTMQVQRDQVPHLYTNATAALEPITPLQDMQIDLDPGEPPASAVPRGFTIGLAQTSAPVPLQDLLSRLDGDTRDYFASLLTSLAQGTTDRGPDMRRMLLALGPTTRKVGEISTALTQRRVELARFVHNLAAVTRAASKDGQLASVVSAGDQTLQAFAHQDRPLRAAIAQLPATLALTRSTLINLRPFADTLGPTLTALLPTVRRLPAVLHAFVPFDQVATPALNGEVRPLVREAQPLLRTVTPALMNMNRGTPALTGDAQTMNYFLNELGYVPGHNDQGFLFWLAWAAHNLNSVLSTGDANGAIVRAFALEQCQIAPGEQQLEAILGTVGLCPK
jgi:phospholipid/cholesterol/gamma-HCH transport system substrate-binding protein